MKKNEHLHGPLHMIPQARPILGRQVLPDSRLLLCLSSRDHAEPKDAESGMVKVGIEVESLRSAGGN